MCILNFYLSVVVHVRVLDVCNCLVGLVVKASVPRGEDPGFESPLHPDCSGSSHTSDLKIGTPVTNLPGTWCYRVSVGAGWPGVSVLWLGEMESLICNFYLSVAAHKIEQICPWDTLACCWDIKQPTNKTCTLCLLLLEHEANKGNNIFEQNQKDIATFEHYSGGRDSLLVVCWAHSPAWCSTVGSILLWELFR